MVGSHGVFRRMRVPFDLEIAPSSTRRAGSLLLVFASGKVLLDCSSILLHTFHYVCGEEFEL